MSENSLGRVFLWAPVALPVLLAGILAAPAPASAMAGGKTTGWDLSAGGMVSIRTDTKPAKSCSGALIAATSTRNHRLVITARHCITDSSGAIDKTRIHVYNGSDYPERGTEYDVKAYAIPTYTRDDVPNQRFSTDLALVQLTKTSPSVAYVYDLKTNELEGDSVTILGYGYVDTDGNARLKTGSFTVTNSNPDNRENHLGSGSAALCPGDDGGPVLGWRNKVIGAVSGFESGDPEIGEPLYKYCDDFRGYSGQSYARLADTNAASLIKDLQ
jgi:V8-like Glu-specific endopeptidase